MYRDSPAHTTGRLSFFIAYGKRFAEAHLLCVKREGVIESLDRDANVIHIIHACKSVILRDRGRNTQTDHDSNHEPD